MKLNRIDLAIEVCKAHLDASKAFGMAIESYLAQYLLVLICATFEEKIESLIIERAGRSGDTELKSFVRSAVDQIFRNPKTSDIGGILNRFSTAYKDAFREEIKSNLQAETSFNNIITNRHKIAHSSGSNMTFAELVESYEEAHTIFDAVAKVLGL